MRYKLDEILDEKLIKSLEEEISERAYKIDDSEGDYDYDLSFHCLRKWNINHEVGGELVIKKYSGRLLTSIFNNVIEEIQRTFIKKFGEEKSFIIRYFSRTGDLVLLVTSI